MLKTLMLVLGLGMGIVAQATTVGPAVGDQAVYKMQTQDSANDPVQTFQTTMEVLSINTLNQTANVQQTITQNGVQLSQNAFDQAFTDMLYPTTDNITNCSTQADANTAATPTSIRVTAGLFQSCRLTSLTADSEGNLSDLYLAVVPFGFVKSTQTNASAGSTQTMELQSYHKN